MQRLVIHHALGYLAAGLVIGHLLAAQAAKFTTVFPIPGFIDGASPSSALLKIGSAYYGTASSGGDQDRGTVFKIDANSGVETTLHSFGIGSDGANPVAPLIAYGGKLFGTTPNGGAAAAGTVFSIDPADGRETVVHSFPGFPGDSNPVAPLVEFGGILYGTTGGGGTAESGTIYKLDPQTGVETSLYSFGSQGNNDGLFPTGGMIVTSGALYGTTVQGGQSGSGTIFRFDPATTTEAPVYALRGGDDGALPEAPLLDIGGTLYGTASQSGSDNHGTVFSFTLGTGAYSVLYAFTGGADGGFPQAGLVAIGRTLYGTSTGFNTGGFGSVFAIDLNSRHETTLHNFSGGYDGAQPGASLLDDNGTLYDVAESGGFNNSGVAFSIDPTTMTESVLHQFSGRNPNSTSSELIRVGGVLYGSAASGGAFGYGAIIQVNAATGAGTVVYSFKGGNDGRNPSGMLVDAGGTLYGTTTQGGTTNQGTVFKLDASGVRTTLHDFSGGADGSLPNGGLISSGNLLYGTTYNGGAANSGTVFSIDPGTRAKTTLYNFSGGADGELPWAPLIVANGKLYGTTLNGGIAHNGVVFSYDPAANIETTVYAFKGGTDGSAPFSPLTSAGGVLYGTTSGFNVPITGGTVFSLNPTTGAETVLHDFTTNAKGTMPLGGVTEFGGKLYGTTAFNGLGYGTIFSLDLGTKTETTLYAFTGGADSGIPQASLLKVGRTFWGTTTADVGNAGTVFKLKP